MRGEFVVEIENLAHLIKVMKAVRRVKGVVTVERRERLRESDLQAESGFPGEVD